MNLLGQTIINGLLIGGIYALIAVGQTMIFGVMKIINFAQGEFLMLGLYVTWMFAEAFGTGNPYLLIVPVATILFIFGMAVYRIIIHPVIGQGTTSYILLTVGLSYFLQNVAQMIWTANPIGINSPIKTDSIKLAALTLALPRVIAFAIAVVFMLMVSAFLSKTDTGRAMRATSENIPVAKMLGINTKKMFMLAFGLGTMFAAIAGCIISPIYYAYPRIGTVFATTIYACVVIGGLGNIKGAFIGGLIIGLIEAFTGSYIALNLAPTFVYAALMIFMIFKPQGLFGGGGRTI
jgi:branched-chain amino acid transport system permease protein